MPKSFPLIAGSSTALVPLGFIVALLPGTSADALPNYKCFADQALRGGKRAEYIYSSDTYYRHDYLDCSLVYNDGEGNTCLLHHDEYHYRATNEGKSGWSESGERYYGDLTCVNAPDAK